MAHKTHFPSDWHLQRWLNGVMLTPGPCMVEEGIRIDCMMNSLLGIYAYNLDSQFIFTNSLIAESHRFLSEYDGLGKSPFDWADRESAARLIYNNSHVLKNNLTYIKEEGFIREDGYVVQATSVKMPLYNKQQKIVGVMGLSIIVDENIGVESFSEGLMELLKTNLVGKSFMHTRSNQNKINLSKRQMECLHFLSRGMTFKQIAMQLNLSPKTIEHYLDDIKNKFGVRRRSELIMKAQNLGMV